MKFSHYAKNQDTCGRSGRVAILTIALVNPVAFQLLEPKVIVPAVLPASLPYVLGVKMASGKESCWCCSFVIGVVMSVCC